MAKEDLLRLVLLPAVSTADQLTDAAGRGFGLSALATEVQEIGGWIEVRSLEGQWTEFSLDLPRFQSV
jgi:chemotaxis protein histidine kinase CheA